MRELTDLELQSYAGCSGAALIGEIKVTNNKHTTEATIISDIDEDGRGLVQIDLWSDEFNATYIKFFDNVTEAFIFASGLEAVGFNYLIIDNYNFDVADEVEEG